VTIIRTGLVGHVSARAGFASAVQPPADASGTSAACMTERLVIVVIIPSPVSGPTGVCIELFPCAHVLIGEPGPTRRDMR
jgi:hypothetical protein